MSMSMFYLLTGLYASVGFPVSFQMSTGLVIHFEIICSLTDQLILLSSGDSCTELLVLMFATLSYMNTV